MFPLADHAGDPVYIWENVYLYEMLFGPEIDSQLVRSPHHHRSKMNHNNVLKRWWQRSPPPLPQGPGASAEMAHRRKGHAGAEGSEAGARETREPIERGYNVTFVWR